MHALLLFSALMPPSWRILKESWFHRWGIARVYPYDHSQGAAWYLTKYVLSDENLSWGLEGTWDG